MHRADHKKITALNLAGLNKSSIGTNPTKICTLVNNKASLDKSSARSIFKDQRSEFLKGWSSNLDTKIEGKFYNG